MCCLFGLIDYGHSLTVKQKERLISALAVSAEDRGTDATGIAYNSRNRLQVYKRPWPAHFMSFHIPQNTSVVMGHTRMATQGKAGRNYNNHPFLGYVQGSPFALAHNGVLYNDHILRHNLRLPSTKIETDSYIGVQLIEQKDALDLNSLRYMAEQVEGSFSFTVLDASDNLYIVKGDNPLCLYRFPTIGLYIYASTERILKAALRRFCLCRKQYETVQLHCGDILCINAFGQTAYGQFDDSSFYPCQPLWQAPAYSGKPYRTHLDEIKAIAAMFGYTPEDIDAMAEQGLTPEDLEDWLYSRNF